MGVPGHDETDMLRGEIEQRALNGANLRTNLDNLRLHVHPQIERDLVVATARSVKLGPNFANLCRKRGFDVHMQIFERFFPGEFPGGYFLLD
jgi:hypothetical protein